jgi:hypothetical protein
VDVDTVASTLALAEQNHAEALKQVCLKYVVGRFRLKPMFAQMEHEVDGVCDIMLLCDAL